MGEWWKGGKVERVERVEWVNGGKVELVEECFF